MELSQKVMLEVANSILNKNIEVRSDYVKKCEELLDKIQANEVVDAEVVDEVEKAVDNRDEIIKNLKAFRLEQSRKEKIKPYYVFNDAQMEDIINKNPQTKEELLQLSGFGNVKVEKYGDEIVRILNG